MDDADVFGDISRMHQKQITIHAGDEGLAETGRILYVEPDWTTDDLLQAAGRRLDLVSTPKRMFNCNGMEVADVMMIEDREVIFFTQGGDYVAPLLSDGADGEGGGSSSGLPAVVGAYKVNEFLGKGGFGEVRVGEHQLTGERVALKFLRKSAIADMGAAERTTTEIQCLTALKHPNIIRLVQHINSPQNVIMVFELAEGGDLYQFLCAAPGQRVDEEEGRSLFRQIVSGVGYAHNQHICHRDMKLDNVLLSRPGCLKEIKLADFGLSDFYRPGATMRTNCGSISYLAPEARTSNAGPPLDVWSIGVILFALLCGRLPFEGSDLQGTNRPREAAIRRRIMECRYKPVESLSPEAKPGRQEERGGLRNAFQDGSSAANASPRGSASGGGHEGSPRLSVGSRGGGSNSPRLLAPLSTRSGTPPADCKAPASPRRSAPGSPRRLQMLDPLEPKPQGGGQQQWQGVRGDLEDVEGVAAEIEAHGGARGAAGLAESERSSGHGGGDDHGGESDDKSERGSHNSGSDSSGEDSHTSRAGRGGRGRDFTLTVQPIRGSPSSGGGVHVHTSSQTMTAAKKEPMIRMNSRLGATHPARSKTLSGLGGLGGSSATINMISGGPAAIPGGGGGGTVGTGTGGTGGHGTGGGGGGGSGGGIRGRGGVLKSRTMDLSNHLSAPSSSAAGAPGMRSTSRSTSPPPLQQHRGQHQQHQRPGTIRQRTWSVSEGEASGQPDTDGEEWRTATPEGGRRNHTDGGGLEGAGWAGKGTGSLPPLSPRSAAEANRHRDAQGQGNNSEGSSRHEHRVSGDSEPGHSPRHSIGNSSRQRGGGGDSYRDRDHRQREEGKSPRESGGGGGGGGDSPRYPSPSSLKGGRAENEEQHRSWHGWGGSWEGKEQDEGDGCRLPASPRGSLPRERVSRDSLRDSVEGGEDEGGSVLGHRGSSPSPSRPQKSSSEGFKLPQSPSARHHSQPQRGQSQGTQTDRGDGRSIADDETVLRGTAGGRSGARIGIAGRSIRRSLTTPSSTATAAEKGTDRGGENGEGEREDHRGERRQDGVTARAARQSSSSDVPSLITASSAQGGAGGEKSTRQQQRRGTLSSAGSDMSSSLAGASERTVEQEGPLAAAFAGSAHPQSRRGEDDQSKENEDEEVELSRR
eukprot:g10736.t1